MCSSRCHPTASPSTRRSTTRPRQNADPVRQVPRHRQGVPARRQPAARSGSAFRNPDMAKAYTQLRTPGRRRRSTAASSATAIVAEAAAPAHRTRRQRHGRPADPADLAAYRALTKAPIHLAVQGFRRLRHAGPELGRHRRRRDPQPHRGVREADRDQTLASLDNANYLHWFSEASATAFADRNRYVGDVPDVPVKELTSDALRRRAGLPLRPRPGPDRGRSPSARPDGSYTSCAPPAPAQGEPYEGQSTTHLVTADKWGNVASYTLTIEQTGGSGITVPGLRVPAQQRADRLQLRPAHRRACPTRTCRARASGRARR